MQARPGRVFEGIANRITHDSRLVGIGSFAAVGARLDEFFRVVPSAATTPSTTENQSAL
jgi:hypothetical protein